MIPNGTRVRWTKANPNGWSGDGVGTVVGFDPARAFFGGGFPENRPGPAFHIVLDGDKKLDVVVGPDELEVLP